MLLDTDMTEERRGKRHMVFQLSNAEEEKVIKDLKARLWEERKTLKQFVLEAIKEKLAHDKKK